MPAGERYCMCGADDCPRCHPTYSVRPVDDPWFRDDDGLDDPEDDDAA